MMEGSTKLRNFRMNKESAPPANEMVFFCSVQISQDWPTQVSKMSFATCHEALAVPLVLCCHLVSPITPIFSVRQIWLQAQQHSLMCMIPLTVPNHSAARYVTVTNKSMPQRNCHAQNRLIRELVRQLSWKKLPLSQILYIEHHPVSPHPISRIGALQHL